MNILTPLKTKWRIDYTYNKYGCDSTYSGRHEVELVEDDTADKAQLLTLEIYNIEVELTKTHSSLKKIQAVYSLDDCFQSK